MATVDKNFRIKNGLAVEGTTATVNGNDILTKNTQDGDSYIINLIGGSADTANTPNAVVKRDGNGDFAAGAITANRINIGEAGFIEDDGGDLVIDLSANGDDFTVNADDIRLNSVDDILLNSGLTGDISLTSAGGDILLQGPNIYAGENIGFTDAERVATRGYVDNAAYNAQSNAEGYTDAQLTNYTTTANLDTTVDGYGYLKSADLTGYATESYVDTAESDANSYTDTKIANSGGAYLDWNGQQLDVDTNGIAQALGQTFDSYGSASSAESNANSYTDGRETAITTAYQSYADTAEQDAKDYADNLINDASNLSTEVWSAYKTSTEIGLAQAAAEQHADDAVAALVGSAPAVLDTIQELATALENNPDIIADLENVAAGKQNTLTAGSNIDITGDTISVTGLDSADISDFNSAALSATSAAYDAAGAAADAQTAAEATAQEALDDVLDATTPFTEINVNDQAKQIATSSSGTATVPGTVYQWAKADYRSAKFLVKIDNGTHNEVSEILLTLDASDNVAITEYAIVGTNGSRGTITADISGSNVRLRVTPANDSTIKVSGTLLV